MKKSNYFLAFSENIKCIRKKAGLSQKEMACILGISASTLSKIEKGVLPPRLSCSVLFRLQQNFGIHPKDLFATISNNDS